MSVHLRLAVLALVAGLIACAALYLAFTARRTAARDAHDRDGQIADLLDALRALEKGNRALDRDLDTLAAALIASGFPDPFAPQGAAKPPTGTQEPRNPPPGYPDNPPEPPRASQAVAAPRPTPHPRTQTYAAVRPQPNPADIPTEAAPIQQQPRNGGAHRATGGTR